MRCTIFMLVLTAFFTPPSMAQEASGSSVQPVPSTADIFERMDLSKQTKGCRDMQKRRALLPNEQDLLGEVPKVPVQDVPISR